MADKKPEIPVRIAVGLSLLGVLGSLLYWDHASGRAIGIGALQILLATWGCGELATFLRNAGAPANGPLLVGTCIVLNLCQILGHELPSPLLANLEQPIVIAFLFALFFPALLGTPSRERFLGIVGTVFGLIYGWLLGSYILRIRYMPTIGEAGALYAILVSKGSDIFAYFTGKAFGRTKLIPNVSPGKTTAGFVGALLGAVVITAAFAHWTPLGTVLPLGFALPVGILLGLVSIAGDLVESYFKRSAELKDSARLLPTFGGILDVTDSILTAGPATFYVLVLLQARASGTFAWNRSL
jgi:phosphatidate cytidylyltransferase